MVSVGHFLNNRMFTTQTEGKECAGVDVMTVTGRMRDSHVRCRGGA